MAYVILPLFVETLQGGCILKCGYSLRLNLLCGENTKAVYRVACFEWDFGSKELRQSLVGRQRYTDRFTK